MHLNNLLPPRSLFLLLRSPKGLTRLVTKVRGWRWPRAKGLARGGSWPEDKGKGKEAKLLLETKGPEAAPKATNPLVSQLGSKEDPPSAKA